MFGEEAQRESVSPRCYEYDECKYLPRIAQSLDLCPVVDPRTLLDQILKEISNLQTTKAQAVSRKRLTELQGVNDIIIKENAMLSDEVVRQRCYIKQME